MLSLRRAWVYSVCMLSQLLRTLHTSMYNFTCQRSLPCPLSPQARLGSLSWITVLHGTHHNLAPSMFSLCPWLWLHGRRVFLATFTAVLLVTQAVCLMWRRWPGHYIRMSSLEGWHPGRPQSEDHKVLSSKPVVLALD